MALTDASSLFPQYLSNLQSNLKGELPQDVTDQIMRTAANYGVARGMPGAPNVFYGGLRDLGLTSLQRQDVGSQQFSPYVQSSINQGNMVFGQNLARINAENAAAMQRNAEASARWNQGPTILGPTQTFAPSAAPSAPSGGGRGGLNAQQMLRGLLDQYNPSGGGGGGSTWESPSSNWWKPAGTLNEWDIPGLAEGGGPMTSEMYSDYMNIPPSGPQAIYMRGNQESVQNPYQYNNPSLDDLTAWDIPGMATGGSEMTPQMWEDYYG